MLKMLFNLKADTKTCHRFEYRDEDGEFITLYLKKTQVKDAGIDPNKPLIVTIYQEEEN